MRTPSRGQFSLLLFSADMFVSSLAIAALTLAGCGASPAGRRPGALTSSSTKARLQVDRDAMAGLGFRLSWSGYPILGARSKVEYFDVYDDVIAVHSDSNVLTLMDAATGVNRWTRQLGQPIDHFVGDTRVGGRLLNASDNELFILDIRTGEIIDKQALAMVVATPPTVMGNVALFGTGAGQVIGHNLDTGFKQWGYQLSGSITVGLVKIGGLVGVVSQSGDTIVIDPRTGASTLRARIFGGLASAPVASDDAMYLASLDQSIYGFTTRGDTWQWRVRTEHPITEQPTLLNGALYVDIPGAGLAALDPANGDRLWTNPDVSGTVVGLRDGDLIVWSRPTSTLFRVDAARGDLLASAKLPGVEFVRLSPTVDGDLFAATPDGVVSKFVPRS